MRPQGNYLIFLNPSFIFYKMGILELLLLLLLLFSEIVEE